MKRFLRSSWGLVRGLTPNRITVYATAVVDLTAALLPIVTDVGATDLIAPVAGLNALALMFLKGWQQYEKALYNAEFNRQAQAAEVERIAAATQPRSAVKLPR